MVTAANLLKGGRELFLYSIPNVPQPLIECGRRACQAAEMLLIARIPSSRLCLHTPHVEPALVGDGGIVGGSSKGKTVFDMLDFTAEDETMNPQELKKTISHGLLSFPLTDFDANLKFAPKPYAARLEWLMPYGATALFAAGGTGEFFSLEPEEFSQVVKTAIDTCRGRMPIIGAAGGGTTLAIKYAQEAERVGAQGVLLMPHYLTEATQAGLVEHIAAVCNSVKLGVIVYNRGTARLQPESLLKLADRCPNLIGFKDGVGDIERFVSVRRRLGDRFSYLGGLPTAEVFAGAYLAMGCPVYSSAVFNFIPRTAIDFYNAHATGDKETTNRLLDEFFIPYIELRNQGEGYAVSIVKAGATIVGHSAGPVRPPLSDLKPAQVEELRGLIRRLGPQ